MFANFREDGEGEVNRLGEMQLGDFGGTYSADLEWATKGVMVGTHVWSSPEMMLEMPWNTATDICSFGTLVRTHSFLYTNNFATAFRSTLD